MISYVNKQELREAIVDFVREEIRFARSEQEAAQDTSGYTFVSSNAHTDRDIAEGRLENAINAL